MMKKNNLGMTHLRLIPKAKGMRVISNQSKATSIELPGPLKEGVAGGKFVRPPTNSFLKEAFCILRHEMKTLPGILGASCFSYHDIYQKLCSFLHEHKSRSSSHKLYMRKEL